MNDDTVVRLVQPDQITDVLTDVLQRGAAELLAAAIEAEVTARLAAYQSFNLPDGRQRLVRHGRLPERDIQTGIGTVKVNVPRVRDRAKSSGDKITFKSSIVPKYVRRTKSLEALIPWLYLNRHSPSSPWLN